MSCENSSARITVQWPNYPRARTNILFLFLIFEGRKKEKKKSKQKVRHFFQSIGNDIDNDFTSSRNISPFPDNTWQRKSRCAINKTIYTRYLLPFLSLFLSRSYTLFLSRKSTINHIMFISQHAILQLSTLNSLLIISNNHRRDNKTDAKMCRVFVGISFFQKEKSRQVYFSKVFRL